MTLFGQALAARSTRSADISGFFPPDVGGPFSDGTIPPPSWGDGDWGVPVSERAAMHLIDAYACTTLIADSLSQLPFAGYRAKGDTREKLPVQPPIYAQPDPECSTDVFLGRFGHSLAVRGNAWAPILEWYRGYPTVARCISDDDVHPVRSRTSGLLEYEIRGERKPWAHNAMIHAQLHPVPGRVRGMSPIECAARGLSGAALVEKFGNRWFVDGAAPSSILETDADHDDVIAKQTQARWIMSHGGGRRLPAVLMGGLKWKAVTLNPNESQFLETRKLNTAQTSRIWRVPGHMIGDTERSTSWGSGIEEMGVGFVVYTLGVYLTRIESAFSAPHVSPRGQYAKLNVGGLLRGNTKDRYAAYALGRQWGWLSVNDIRALEDLPPIDGGDTYLQPLNMIDAEAAIAKAKLDQQTEAAA